LRLLKFGLAIFFYIAQGFSFPEVDSPSFIWDWWIVCFREQEATKLIQTKDITKTKKLHGLSPQANYTDITAITKFADLGLTAYFQAPLHPSALHSSACIVFVFVFILYVCCESWGPHCFDYEEYWPLECAAV
jgi:hypothetical protein